MFCSKCGKELPVGAKFCPKCGSKIETQTNTEIGETIKNTADKVANEIDNTVKSVANEVESVTSEFNRNFEEAQKNVRKQFQITSDEIKNFKFENLLEKKYVDLSVAVASVGPFALMVLYFVLFGIVGNIISSTSFYGLVYITNNAFAIIAKLLVVIFMVISLGSLGLLVYRAVKHDEKETIHIFEMVSSFIAFIALLGFFITKASWLRYFGFISLILGFDFIIKLLVKKIEIYEPLDYAYDFGVIKEQFNKMKEARAAEKAKDAEAAAALETMDIVTADLNAPSDFDGKGLTLFGYELLAFFVSLVTCGLGIPFMVVTITKWRVSHTIINGKRLTFNGTALQLFGLFIKWVLLTCITCGIYGYFAYVDYLKWETKHTAYEGTPIVGSYYKWSSFRGNSFEYLGYSILTGIVTGITCMIAYPWMQCLINRWQMSNTYYNRQKMKLDLTGGKAFGTYLLTALLTIITCGLYSPWATCKINKMILSNTHVDPTYVEQH